MTSIEQHASSGAISSDSLVQAVRPLSFLVVEDSADALHMICELLIMLGHQAQGTLNAEAALDALAIGKFDVLFTDVSLPGMSGIALARKAVQDAPTLKVIFSSGYEDGMSRYIGFPSIWLTKPFDFAMLQSALDELMSAL